MKNYTFGFVALLLSLSTHAGTGSHGGDGLICFNKISSKEAVQKVLEENSRTVFDRDPFADKSLLDDISDVKLLDLYLAELRAGYRPVKIKGKNEKKVIQNFLDKIRSKSSFFKDIEIARDFLDKGGWYSNPGAILEIDDSDHTIIFPENCVLIQLAAQTKISSTLSKVFFDERIMSKMSLRNKVALMFHEWLYYVAINNKNIDSRGVQDLVALLFSEDFNDMDAYDFKMRIVDSGVFPVDRLNTPKSEYFFGLPVDVVIHPVYISTMGYVVNKGTYFTNKNQSFNFQGKEYFVESEYTKRSGSKITYYTFDLKNVEDFEVFGKAYKFSNEIVMRYVYEGETRVAYGELQNETNIGDLYIHKKVSFEEDLSIISSLGRNYRVNGNVFPKDTGVSIGSGLYTFSGKLLELKIRNGLQQIIPCKHEIQLYKISKALYGCYLSKAYFLNGKSFAKNAKVTFYESGHLKSGFSENTMPFNGGWFNNTLSFYPDGSLKKGALEVPAVFDSVSCGVGITEFTKAGKLEFCSVDTKTEVELKIKDRDYTMVFVYRSYSDHSVEKNTIRFYKSPYSIQYGCMKKIEKRTFFQQDTGRYKPLIIEDIKFGLENYSCARLYFHSNGAVKTGYLYEDTEIDGVIYKAESKVSFDRNGNVVKLED